MTTLLDRYLSRIGVPAPADELRARVARDPDEAPAVLDELLAAHEASIPFENIDIMAGDGVDIEPDAVAAKLLDGGRGGYCHEHVALFRAALTELGLPSRPVLARILLRPGPEAGPRSHQASLVTVGGRDILADPGFGAGTPPVALPLDRLGEVRTTPQGDYRLSRAVDVLTPERRADHDIVLEHRDPGEQEFRAMYGFHLLPVAESDVATANWWTSTRPGTHFTTGLVISQARPDGGRLSLSGRELRETTPAGREVHTLADETELAAVLRERFGLTVDDGQVRRLWEVSGS